MFGYLRPLQDELKVKDARLYRAVYCGICRAIAQTSGQLPRIALQYDAVLPAMLWMGLSDQEPILKPRRCIAQPIKRHLVMENHTALNLAGDICLLLAHRKLVDDAADEGKWLSHAGGRLLYPVVNKAQKRIGPNTLAIVDRELQRLTDLEKQRCTQMDEVADASGRIMEAIFLCFPQLPPSSMQALSWLGYHTGRWVYLADCMDDYERDAKTGAYNVLLESKLDKKQAFSLAWETCDYAAAQAAAALDLLDIKRYGSILENYYFAGLPHRLTQLAKKEQMNEQPLEDTGRS